MSNQLRLASVASMAISVLCATTTTAQTADQPSLTPEITAPARALGAAYAAVAKQISPAVVSVSSEKMVKQRRQELPFPFGDEFLRHFFGNQFGLQDQQRKPRVPEHGLGSGIIIDKQGHVLTNYHVVRNVDVLKIIMADRRSFDAKVVGTDPKTDIAIIQLKGPVPADWPLAALGDSDALSVGDLVLAVGAPFGLTQTVTSGIISATGRANVGIADFEDFLQTDAAINPGNSGGPLVNMRGEVIGVNTAIATSVGQYSGVGFSIPSKMVKRIMPVLLKGGTVKRGMLGIGVQDLTPELARQFQVPIPQTGGEPKGALVTQVSPNSPAEKAGLKTGDIVVRYQGKPVDGSQQLRNLTADTAPGSQVDVTVLRGGKEQTFKPTVGQLSAPRAEPKQGAHPRGSVSGLGLLVEPLTPDVARQLGYQGQTGVLVAGVEDGGLAAEAGIREGDLITEVNRQKVTGVNDLEQALAKADLKTGVLLLIRHGDASLYVVLRRP